MKLSLRLERELKTLDALEDLGYTCRNLGDLYKVGHPYQDLEKALKLYQKAYDIFREADCRKQTTESMENVQICQECLADIWLIKKLPHRGSLYGFIVPSVFRENLRQSVPASPGCVRKFPYHPDCRG